MDRVDGRAPEDTPPYHAAGWVHGLRPEERARLWWNGLDQLARIHRIDPVALGLTFLDHPERGRPGLDQQLHYYDDYFDWVAGGRPHPTVTDARRWLEDHRPADEPVGLVWGDSRLGNVLFGEDLDVVAVVDWEMVTLGNPVEDLAWWLFLDRHHSVGVERLAGFPSPEETVARWEQATGRSAAHLAYYEVFAAYRFSVIMLRVIDLAIELGYMPADATHGIDNTCSQLLAGLLGLPAPSTR
jgi:aminoglycoside phosphotransferase (APT) family kinase protein